MPYSYRIRQTPSPSHLSWIPRPAGFNKRVLRIPRYLYESRLRALHAEHADDPKGLSAARDNLMGKATKTIDLKVLVPVDLTRNANGLWRNRGSKAQKRHLETFVQ